MSSPGWARRSTEGSVACTHEMRVRFPPGPPEQLLSTAAEGRDGDLGGLISLEMRVRFPPPRPTARSFNGRTAVLQTAHGGSIPSPATTSMVGEGKRRAAGLWNLSGRRVIGSPPASGAGVWRFESSRPDHSLPLVGWWQRQHVRLLTGKIRVRIPALQPRFIRRNPSWQTGNAPAF